MLETPKWLNMFMALFGVTSLEDIIISGRATFANPSERQKFSLRESLQSMVASQWKSRVTVVVELFPKIGEEASFFNFLGLMSFVNSHFKELPEKTASNRSRRIRPRRHVKRLTKLYMKLKRQVRHVWRTVPLDPAFGNDVTCISHHLKHRRMPPNSILTVCQYLI